MSLSALIDLASLPRPDALEMLDFEALLAARKAALIALWPAEERADIAATLALESEPLARLLQENCYRELVWRQRVNDALRAVMLAYATGADLEQRAALFGVERLVVAPGDPAGQIPAQYESDADLRRRIQLAPQGFSTAGPAAAYVSRALAVDGRLLDARSSRPRPGDVLVTLLARDGDGTAPPALLDAVARALSAEDQRPLNDTVQVASADIVRYRVRATVFTQSPVGAELLVRRARDNVRAHVDAMHRIGAKVATSALIGVIQAAGITRTDLSEPAVDLVTSTTAAPYCEGIEILDGGVDD
ncbi:baseplate J/gp47 family protein [Burkholderia sp. FERM BP-3421]|jgi:phage-related baseplate assembly protein|uniref:baseplate J/gp47 family protein n=1 Tax=Burkholderia sp. FERM BP-3421 TaxID=1494466 RepID=UPI00235E83F9|nr:baseplate J/gp47 family protein [Burkholderia sp. FERM BP-3421]WDD95933.1 baseplate J/gp47 family protein [Burkholderia sp. FERM BP-3421]